MWCAGNKKELKMGREVRRVPANWEHPMDDRGFVPLHDGYNEAKREWELYHEKWKQGLERDWSVSEDEAAGWVPIKESHSESTFEDYYGKYPNRDAYMPDWPDEERTHWQMYENVSEGTPISPVCASAEELAHWLADNNANAGCRMVATYEQWLDTCIRGFSMSLMITPDNRLVSGVEGMCKTEKVATPNSGKS
jgi:hypothetical protein